MLASALAALPASAQTERFAAYARARAAEARGDVTVAAAQYGRVLDASPGDTTVAARTWREAMAAGDLPLARRAAAAGAAAGAGGGTLAAEIAVLAVADAIRSADPAALKRAFPVLGDSPLGFVVPVIAAWASLGTAADPAAAIATTAENGALARVVRENHALLLIAAGRFDAAIPDLRVLLADDSGELDLRYAAAELLTGQGKASLAAKLVAGDDSQVVGFRAAIPAAKPSAAFGVGRVFTRIAAGLEDVRLTPLAVALTRSALLLDPGDDRARIVLAGALGRLKAYDRAVAVIGEIGPASAFRMPADEKRVALLRAGGDTAAALAAAKALAEAPSAGPVAAQIYGDLLDEAGRERDAVAAYSLARDRMGDDAGWGVWLQIASAYDGAGDWSLARPAFDRAVELGGNEAVVLTAYGAALIARGGDGVPRAIAMLERADNLAPNRPDIGGALAWGYLRRGEVSRALPLLEAASRAAPGNPSVADHLGDAYWSAGRRYEARYAWRAALAVADPAATARIEAKLRDGLPVS